MKFTRAAALLPAVLLSCAAISAQADTIVVPFSLNVGPSQVTVQVPQFDPARGTLTGVTISASGSIQYLLDIFNTGPGTFSATAHDTLLFGMTPVMTGGTFSGSIPANQMVFTYSPVALNFGPLTEVFGPSLAGIFTGTGTVPFDLSLPAVTIDQFSGSTVLNVLGFSAASGNVTADYMFTPAVTAPEPALFGTVGLSLLSLVLVWRRR
ncbi:MAG: choice-of-anchor E domain-containing protein [Bryobacteraceae bacterium]